MSTPANFNGARPIIDVNDAVMLLIDHQSGLFQTVGDMPMPELRARAAALAPGARASEAGWTVRFEPLGRDDHDGRLLLLLLLESPC